MLRFFAWVGIACMLVGLLYLLIRKIHSKSRFRTKLTMIFLLFVAIPVIPLTYMAASLLTGSASLLLPDTIGEALNSSLNCVRIQLVEKGEYFLDKHPNPFDTDPQSLADFSIHSLSYYKINPDTAILIRHITHTNQFNEVPAPREILQRFGYGSSSRLLKKGQHEWFCLYRTGPDSTMIVLKYLIDTRLAQSRQRIETALIMVNTLSMIKESVIQKKIIWVLAVLWIAGLIGLAWLASQRLSREMTRPIQALVHGMDQVAVGNLNYQIQTKANDEFKYLVDQFNIMTKDLQHTHERLLQAERLAAWQAVARQISHEIKNSLTPISISLHRIKKQLGSSIPSNIISSIHTIEEEMAMLQTMATEFSSFARMPKLNIEKIQMNEIVQAACQLMRNCHPNIQFQLSLDSDAQPIIADRDQMKRVVNNLLKNAVEAIDKTGNVWITTKTILNNNITQLEIRDSGKGIDENTRPFIFQPYFSTKKRGTGLGMTMVDQIIKAHHGSIQVSSIPDQGTQITVELPISNDA